MPIKKKPKKKAAGPPHKKSKRSQIGNDAASRAGRPAKVARSAKASGDGARTICANVECKLRRAGCYGYEACPGFKGRSV